MYHILIFHILLCSWTQSLCSTILLQSRIFWSYSVVSSRPRLCLFIATLPVMKVHAVVHRLPSAHEVWWERGGFLKALIFEGGGPSASPCCHSGRALLFFYPLFSRYVSQFYENQTAAATAAGGSLCICARTLPVVGTIGFDLQTAGSSFLDTERRYFTAIFSSAKIKQNKTKFRLSKVSSQRQPDDIFMVLSYFLSWALVCVPDLKNLVLHFKLQPSLQELGPRIQCVIN